MALITLAQGGPSPSRATDVVPQITAPVQEVVAQIELTVQEGVATAAQADRRLRRQVLERA